MSEIQLTAKETRAVVKATNAMRGKIASDFIETANRVIPGEWDHLPAEWLNKYQGEWVNLLFWCGDWWIMECDNIVIPAECITEQDANVRFIPYK